MKVCKHCQLPKEDSEFYKAASSKDGLHRLCKVCHGLATREYAAKNPEQVAATSKRWRANNRDLANQRNSEYRDRHPDKVMLRAAKSRAVKQGLLFDLEPGDIAIPDLCPLLKVTLEKGTMYAPSLDRIKPEKGYVKGNVVVISLLANLMKSQANFLELCTFCENAPKFYLALLNNTK